MLVANCVLYVTLNESISLECLGLETETQGFETETETETQVFETETET
jgi:hypothetical protein